MCGGAIISDLILPVRSRRATADCIWPGLGKKKKKGNGKLGLAKYKDDFEADFQEFDDEGDAEVSDLVDEEDLVEFNPFAIRPKAVFFSRRKITILKVQ
ncbi:hypothetical protein HPP92_026044 [Vanilla planifolia]|uniref:Uncharacterized protein n=1 Tax=Vanilla planifolia TaxID=51239 RepID=A0A835PGL4_VANPL|nr:hypothetical protein HPP92_026044 [Vanilla planifolia]